jgi:tetrahydromethanopterin S-methyltransferase subunit G
MERKFDYFVEQTNHRLDKIDEKLEQLISFRVMLIGASMAVATLFSVVTTLITLFINK